MKVSLHMNEVTLDHLFTDVLAKLHSFRSASDGSWYDRGYEDALWATLEQIHPRMIDNRIVKDEALRQALPDNTLD